MEFWIWDCGFGIAERGVRAPGMRRVKRNPAQLLGIIGGTVWRGGVLAVLCGAALLLGFGTGCGRAGKAPASATGGGQEGAAARPRLVSLSPNLTEMVCALGGEELLVGRSRVCTYPPDMAARVPVVGDFCRPSLEKLAAVRPTLVIAVGAADPATERQLARLGIASRIIVCDSLDAIPRAMLEVGRCIGREDAARAQAARFRGELEALRRLRPPAERQPLTFIEIWGDPPMTAGRQSFVAELVRLAGGRNLGDELDRDYVQISTEWVITRDPEVILCLNDGAAARDQAGRFRNRSGWSGVRAVAAGRVYGGFDLDLMLKPGPRVLQTVPALRAVLQPPPGPAAP